MLTILKKYFFLLAFVSVLVSNAQAQPMLAEVEQEEQITPRANQDASMKDSVAQQNAYKLNATKQRLNVAQDIEKAVTIQESLEGTISSLSTQIMQNQKLRTLKPIIITSFVRLDNLKSTSEFGRIVSESLINELSNRGFNVVEFRGQLGVSLNEQGEYFITRDTKKLNTEIANTYVVVGTYSRQFKNIMLNARIIDNSTGKIISSSRATYAHGLRDDCIIFKDCKPPRTIKIIKE